MIVPTPSVTPRCICVLSVQPGVPARVSATGQPGCSDWIDLGVVTPTEPTLTVVLPDAFPRPVASGDLRPANHVHPFRAIRR